MSFYKDLWNERYREAYDEAVAQGRTHAEADYVATRHAEGTAEHLAEAADLERKRRKEEG